MLNRFTPKSIQVFAFILPIRAPNFSKIKAWVIAILKSVRKERLHKYIRQKQKVKHTIGPLKKPDGSLTATNEESAEALASFFQSVFVHEDI